MPSYLYPLNRAPTHEVVEPELPPSEDDDSSHHVDATLANEEAVAGLHQTITGHSFAPEKRQSIGPFAGFEDYLRRNEEEGASAVPLSACFKNVTTYGRQEGAASTKTLKDAIVRTLTLQDIYEWTLKKLISPERVENGRALIRDFTGVVRNGEMMLVLGNPGSGCSTFLRTIGNDHSSFLGVKGTIDYSGLSPSDVLRKCRGLVSYIPEDDVHLPTLTVRQTLEFALQTKTPKRSLHKIPVFLEEFGRVFGMTHVLDTLVGNEFIRGVSGGERKRVSILESLASGSSVNTWDGSTRGLDASSAVDYIKSLRIMTDACQRATAVSLYQASDAIYQMVDKVMLIDEGRMIYQGPANQAEAYFNALGYERMPRQTMSDFLTSIPLGDPAVIREGYEFRVPRGAENLEQAFRSSHAFQDVQKDVSRYEDERREAMGGSETTFHKVHKTPEFKQHVKPHKSRYVSSRTPYNTSFLRQVVLCTKREAWKLRGHLLPFFTRLICNIGGAFLLGSMFYKMPVNTDGMYSRGGFSFYSAALVAWFQLAELEEAFQDRTVVSRQKRYAAVRPSAVVAGKGLLDCVTIFIQSAAFSIVAYFLAGMELAAGAFFSYLATVFLCAMVLAACYRTLGAGSRRLEVALRFCGVYILISVIFGGYLRSVERLVHDVPWVGWLAYLTPVLYSFEIIMAMEFHGRYYPCASGSVIPSGAGYNDPSFQSCAATGVAHGDMGINGDDYLHTEFGFSFNNVGRDFGILILFTLGFLVINMLLVEKIDWVDSRAGGLRYSHNPKSSKPAQTRDEENTNDGAATPVVEEVHLANDAKGLVQSGSTFTWRDLNYTVRHKDGDKQLLNGVSGYCEPGKLTALVGASGAGKSTLMAVLTQQSTGNLTGDMKINDTSVDASFGREIGYCQQMDIHVPTSTVREAFEFSALLRQSADTPKESKIAYVDEVLDILGMGELQNVIIGSLSLEQKKRTTIGVELCAKPSLLLFLDEPTSGLDSQGAMSIVRLLRKLADCGQAIICTIHQASQEQFEQFDRVLALARGGKTYYFGDIGANGSTVLNYFSRHGLTYDAGKNVADVLIEATAQHSDTSTTDWCSVWNESPEAAATQRVINQASNERVSPMSEELQPTSKKKEFASSTVQQIILLTKRTMVQYWRTPDYVYSRLYCSFFHSALTGLAFLQLGNTLADMQYRIYAYFMVLMIVPEFVNACSMMLVENRNIWLGRENPSRIYGWVAFTSAQIVSEIPWALSGGILYYILFYFLVGFPLGTPAGYTFLMMMMFHLFCTSWGQWIAALSADAVMAASIMPLFVIVCEFFNGVLQPRELMPAVWAYTIYYIGPFTYWISGIAAMVLPGVNVLCAENELTRFQAPDGETCEQYAGDWLSGSKGYLVNPDATSDCGYCQYKDGDEYISKIELNHSMAWPYLGIFALFTFTNYLCVYFWVYIKSVRNWLPW